MYARTGLRVSPIFSALKLEWLKENTPEHWERASGWLGMSEYMAFRMTGTRSTDPSLASRTMLFKITSSTVNDEPDGDIGGESDEELCSLAGIPVEILPPVYPSGTGRLTSEAAAKISALPGIPVVVCGHDHICGAFGAGATAPGEIVDYMGTAEASILTLTRPPSEKFMDESGCEPDAPANLPLGLPVGCHVLPNTYYMAATLPASGGLVERLLKLSRVDEKICIQRPSTTGLGKPPHCPPEKAARVCRRQMKSLTRTRFSFRTLVATGLLVTFYGQCWRT